jgi:hypothetical protein
MWRINDRGIALILVVSVLAIAAIMAISFVFTMRLESRAALNYQDSLKAGYLAEAGIAHARAVLGQDMLANSFDTNQDSWRTTFWGDAVDNNEDGSADSQWLEVQDSSGQVIGRYAVLIEDEAGKVNINVAGRHNTSPLKVTEGWTPFEISLEKFLSQFGLGDLAEGIINYRYGQDGAPGVKGIDDDNDRWILESDNIDNNADGNRDEPQEGIDEPDEFNPDLPLGDDRPFLTSEGIKKVEGFDAAKSNEIKNFITAYSADKEISSNGELKHNLNMSNPDSLLALCLEVGVGNPWQKVVNLTDFVDTDNSRSCVTKYSRRLYVNNIGPQGDWTWQADHYENANPGGTAGSWSWGINIPEGEYFLFIYGSGARYVGDVTIDGRTKEHMKDGDQFRKVTLKKGWLIFPDLCGLTISIQNNEAPGVKCFFKSFELVPVQPTPEFPSVEVYGVESIRINEIMVRPLIKREAGAEQNPGGDWIWTGTSFQNANPGGGITGEGNWVFKGIPDGEYYLTIYGESEGQDVGDVKVEGIWQDKMDHQDRFIKRQTVTVTGGKFYISIQNNEAEGKVCYFKSIELSQQPDAEYIELVNISPRTVELGGWSVEGPGPDAFPAFIPAGTSIGPYKYLVISFDKDDTLSGISGNGISLRNIWGDVDSVQLDFSKGISPLSDPLKDNPIPNIDFVVLKDSNGHIVDKVEYTAGQIQDYRSLERGDPTSQEDRDGNGEFDGWILCEDLTGGTPGKRNDNNGMSQTDEKTGEIIRHNIEEVEVSNTPLATIADSVRISDGSPWRKFSLDDLIKLSDKVTVYGRRLEAEGAKIISGWSEAGRATPLTNWFISTTPGQEGSWLWTGLKNGRYLLTIYGQEEEVVCISLHLANGSWTDWTPPLIPGSNNAVFYGIVEVGTGTDASTPDGKLELKIKNSSLSGTAHFDYLQLDPQIYIWGRININTAGWQVLMALPGIDKETAQKIIANRPYGNKDGLNRGIGDILLRDVLGETEEERIIKFKPISNLITVRSDVYRVVATGQVLEDGRVVAEKRIWAVVER